uniref:Uncharacterized protein n=1 Tax=Anopheles albimanus TaxID=7167 RepID=A0A182FWL3_ANOAL
MVGLIVAVMGFSHSLNYSLLYSCLIHMVTPGGSHTVGK